MVDETCFKLSNSPGALGLSCEKRGVALAGVPLLHQSEDGLEPRPNAQLQALFSRAYGVNVNAERLTAGLAVVARALNAGDMAKAMTAAVLLKLPDLDWNGAVRIAQAEKALLKYSEDQPRDWHGRWTDGDSGGPALRPASHMPAPHIADISFDPANRTENPDSSSDGVDHTANPFALPADWLHLPPGERTDELGDLAEWIANARPEDGPAIREDIQRLFYDVGDGQGGDGISAFLNDDLQPDVTLQDRQRILDALDHFTRTDPAAAARFTGLIYTVLSSGSALLELPEAIAGVIGAIGETAAVASDVWKLGWAARGFAIEKALGGNLVHNFPVIDSFLNGIATSIKLIDLNANMYQDAARLTSRVNAYVDKVASFNGAQWGNFRVESWEIEGRALNLAIPKGSMTAEQQAAIAIAKARARSLNVKFIVTPF